MTIAAARLGAVGVALGLVMGGASPAEAQLSDPSTPAISQALVLASRLNVRASPSLSGDVRGSAPRGASLCIIRIAGEWVEVRTPVGERPALHGFVSRGFISERRVSAAELEELGCNDA